MSKPIIRRPLLDKYLLTITILTFILIIFSGAMAPLTNDDWLGYYHHKSNIIKSIYDYYLEWSGRIPGVIIGYYSVGSDIDTKYGAINGLGFICLVFLSFALAKGRWPKLLSSDQLLFFILTAVLWFALPTIGQTVFWRAGASVYLWPCFFASIFLLPFRFKLFDANHQHASGFRNFTYSLLMLFLGIWVGCSHEQIFTSVLALTSIWLYFIYKGGTFRNIPVWLFIGVFGLIIGGSIMILAPGNTIRYSYYHHQTVIDKIISIINFLFSIVTSRSSDEYWNMFIPWILILLILSFIDAKKISTADSHKFIRIKDKAIFFSFLIASSLALIPILILASFATVRASFFCIYFLITAIASLSNIQVDDALNNLHSKIIFTIVIFLSIHAVFFDALITATRMWKMNTEITKRELYLKKVIDNGGRDIEIPPITTRPGRTIFFEDMSDNPKAEINLIKTKHYNINSIKVRH